jgi:hypothetical protein
MSRLAVTLLIPIAIGLASGFVLDALGLDRWIAVYVFGGLGVVNGSLYLLMRLYDLIRRRGEGVS